MGFRSAPRWRVAEDCQDDRKLAGVREGKFQLTPLTLRLGDRPLAPAYPSHELEPVTPTLSTHMPCERELEASATSAI